MSAPPGDPVPPAAPPQPLPQQPLPTTPPQAAKPPSTGTQRRTRQRPKAADPPATPQDSDKAQNSDSQQQKSAQDQPQPSSPAPPPPPPAPPAHSHHYPTPPGPIFQPYHHPYPIMNPTYPINGPGPYGQHPHPQYMAQHPQVPQNPNPPQHPQYAYSMHPAAYPHHPSYATYPQYHQPMMMYPPTPRAGPQTPDPAQQQVSPTPQSAPVPPQIPSVSAVTGNKRKRKESGRGDKGSDDETAASNSDAGRAQQSSRAQQPMPTETKKRTKTQRACDSCRSRKIRCDILPETDPPICQHCKQYSFECTFFLPITETRFKKKKLEEEAANQEREKAAAASSSATAAQEPQAKRDIGIIGPTSPIYLLHSQASVHSKVYENYDQRHHHSFTVGEGGDGMIRIQKPTTEEQQVCHPRPLAHVDSEVIQTLVNAYFTDVAPILPIITKAEFLATPSPPPILLYSMCLVAAARREVDHGIFDSIRHIVNSIIKADDVLSEAKLVNVQALLILSMTGDCHSQFVPTALSALWIRLGTAIRMAQDLGLHRAESVKHDIEQRRRLWAACLISDRWVSIAYGHPYLIDVLDCDARLPSSGDPNDLYLDELVRLSIILGRVQKTIYTPSGLNFTTDDMLYELLADIQRWKEGLPDHLRFNGPDTPHHAGLLHLLYACVCMIFWRVFMRISYTVPAHLKFSLTVEQWTELVTITAECIDWLDAHERLYDVWLLVAYASTSLALVQYHTFIRRKDAEAQGKLKKLRDCVRRWESAISPDHMSTRRKTAEIISLLYEATQGPPMPMEAPALNPTGGVTGKPPVMLDYRKDPTRPGGGVFIVQGNSSRDGQFKDVPEGTIISEQSAQGGTEIIPPATSTTSAPLVNFTPLNVTGSAGRGSQSYNVNPAMNVEGSQSGSVQVMNMLDASQSGSSMADLALADNGFLEGLPGGMFDWNQWDAFFARFTGQGNANAFGAGNHQQQEVQQQQQQPQQQQVQQQRQYQPSPQQQHQQQPPLQPQLQHAQHPSSPPHNLPPRFAT
ncbi:hypothetical protein CC1G_01048 [Coprinopsis cinerea okayama7|uniref:Zn(2)-C6 fungal-type domain-containing protein n=1 Tax=Coprinopsis cinerea (strain Okayama-7 / 130 / ATCC MYA-4618 / FGSC 9003) TaxID=240176 RepID=A8NEC3_COPC7|nr:hypothetical protein CC1G_01048 [Coprinopsis cinerea okayama7\|eukprot:XP_001832986.2 hypothetical protein CC1G_01048 [Coprinopsis cinerea okayama7\